MKKGFTLIEVLGTIGLLGILLLIITVSYNSIVRKARQDAYDRQINTIIQGAKDWALDNSSIVHVDNYIVVTIDTLLDEGYLEGELINPKTEQPLEGCVLILWDSSYQQFTYEYTVDKCIN